MKQQINRIFRGVSPYKRLLLFFFYIVLTNLFKSLNINTDRWYVKGVIELARNKYPEQTVEHILSTAAKLFTEKGFEKTSIQDILNELGMSKGAIYHHFRSKEEILDRLMQRQVQSATELLHELIAHTEAPNARVKLMTILETMVADQKARSLDTVISTQLKNPQMVLSSMKEGIKIDAPIIAEIMIAGQEDGSISTDYPLECAEAFMLLVNIWVNPQLFERNQEETIQRLKFIQHMMRLLGADIVSDTLIHSITERHSVQGYSE